MKKIAAALALLLLLASCGGRTASTTQQHAESKQGRVVVAISPESEPQAGFDPAYGWGAGEHVHEPLIQSTLTVTTPDLGIGYDLATDMQTAKDGLTWTVTIRDDVRFSDGQPLTAYDIAFTYNLVKEKSMVNDFTMLDYAEAVDGQTVVFHLNRPYSIWPYSMASVGILPEHAYDAGYGANPIGSGRYLLKQWDKGQQVLLEANPDYYGEAPLMREVTIVFMSEETALAAIRTGEVQVAYTSVAAAGQELEGKHLLAVRTVDNRGINLPAIPFDGEKGNDLLADPLVRQALHVGLDRQALVDDVLDGYGTPAYSVCDQMPWYNPVVEVEHDFAQACALLEQAGWLAGEDGIRMRDGARAKLQILYPAYDSDRQAVAAALSGQIRQLGIEADFEGVGWDTAYNRAQCSPMVWGWGAHTPMELYNLYHTRSETGLAEFSPYASSQADRYMDEALAAQELEESYQLWQRAQWDGEAGFASDLPWIWLVNVDHLYWVEDGLVVAEQKLHPHGHGWSILNHVDQWFWEEEA